MSASPQAGRVLVVGSINMDIVVSATRQPRMGETLRGEALAHHPGGKGANQAVAAARLGANVAVVGAVGTDGSGEELVVFLSEHGIDLAGLRRVEEAPTGTAVIVVAGGENAIVVVPGANDSLLPTDVEQLAVGPGDVVVTQLEIAAETAVAALARAREGGATTILNAAPVRPHPPELRALADVLVVNEIELAALAGTPILDGASRSVIERAVRAVRAAPGQTVVATRGARGALALVGDEVVEVAGISVPVVDTTGAGDCFVGVLAACLAARQEVAVALRSANLAASLCVQHRGAGPSMPDAQELARARANM